MKSLDGQLLSQGAGPVLMEPVVAAITLPRPGATVAVCDHDGDRTATTIRVDDRRFTIDGRESQTIYYQVVY
jgi:hypothetical protein